MKSYIPYIILILLSLPLKAQNDTISIGKAECHEQFNLSLGTAFLSGPFGSLSLYGIRPTFTLRPTDKLTVKTSLGITNAVSLAPHGYHIQGHQPRSLSPVRHPATSTLGTFTVSAAYRASDRLSLAASLMLMGGEIPSVWSGTIMPVSAAAFSASVRYQIGQDSYIDINTTIIDDRTGALLPYIYNPYLYSTYPTPYFSPFH